MRDSFIAGLCACVLALICTSASAQAPAPQLERADLEAWLDGLVPYAIEQGDIAGMIVSVVKDGQVLLEKGYGYADVAAKVPMDPQRTVAGVASLSKTFTATLVMQLVERGKLDLDRDVNQYLDFEIPAAFAKPVTLRHLLTHTAGFADTSYKKWNPPQTLRQSVMLIPQRIYPPGEVPAYSNYSLGLAGYIAERACGEPFAACVEHNIFEPLQMRHSTFRSDRPAALRELESKYYTVASREPLPPNHVVPWVPLDAPAGNLATTADDMTRFMLAHLQHGRYGDHQLLSPQALEAMHAPSFTPMPGAQPVALGLFRADYKGHRIIGHAGDGEGIHAEMKLLPDQNVGIFTAVNSDGFVQGIFPAAFIVRAMLVEQFVDRYFPTPSPPQEPTASTAQEHAQLAAGEYAWSRRPSGDFQDALGLIARFFAFDTKIRAHADGTIVTPAPLTFEKNGREQTWREVGPFEWREVGGDARLFMTVRDGKVHSVWSDQIMSFWLDRRVPYLWSAQLHAPLFMAATVALVLTALLWPVAAIVRRRYGRTMQLPQRELQAYRLTRYAVVLAVVYLLGWIVALGMDAPSSVAAAPWIRLIQLIGLLCALGAAIAVWNSWLTWGSVRSVWARIWSTVLALALLYLVWFSFAFNLISARLS